MDWSKELLVSGYLIGLLAGTPAVYAQSRPDRAEQPDFSLEQTTAYFRHPGLSEKEEEFLQKHQRAADIVARVYGQLTENKQALMTAMVKDEKILDTIANIDDRSVERLVRLMSYVSTNEDYELWITELYMIGKKLRKPITAMEIQRQGWEHDYNLFQRTPNHPDFNGREPQLNDDRYVTYAVDTARTARREHEQAKAGLIIFTSKEAFRIYEECKKRRIEVLTFGAERDIRRIISVRRIISADMYEDFIRELKKEIEN